MSHRDDARPPRLARLLVGRFADPREREFLLGDLEEEHAAVQARAGRLAAWRWYWIQAVRSVLAAGDSSQEEDSAAVPRGALLTSRPGSHGRRRSGHGRRRSGRGQRRRRHGGRRSRHGQRGRPDGPGRRAWATAAESVLHDLRHALLALRRAPGFTALVVLALGLGVGGTTTFFSVADGVVLSPLPYPESERLVRVSQYRVERGIPTPGAPGNTVSYPDLVDLRREAEVFESMAAAGPGSYLLLGGNEPVEVDARQAEPEVFDIIGVPAALGRTLRQGDEDTAVLGHELWTTRFGADPDVVGTTISLDHRPFVVVGVMPPDHPDSGRVWVPLDRTTHDELDNRRGKWFFTAWARLADGVTLEQARAAMRVAGRRLAAEHPETNEGWAVWVHPLHAEVVGDAGATVWLLLGASAVLLLIASANVAHLQLVRLEHRRRETAVRVALGAGRRRVVQHLFVEGLTLGVLGGGAGILLAVWGVRTFVALAPGRIPRLDAIRVDGTALSFTLGIVMLTSLLFGLLPALRAAGKRLRPALQRGENGSASGLATRRLRNGLLAAEVALTLVLLAGAGLMVDSYLYLWMYEPGFDPADLVTFRVAPDLDRYPEPSHRAAFYTDLYARLRALPEVDAVGGIARLPGAGKGGDVAYPAVTEEASGREEGRPLRLRPVSGDIAGALGLSTLAGRSLRPGADQELLLNRAAVELLWPELSPGEVLGRRIRFFPDDPTPWQSVVGVVEDTRYHGLFPEPQPEVWVLHSWPGFRGATFNASYVVVRTDADPSALIPAIRESVWALDADQPVEQLATMEQALAASMARPRFYTFLFAVFGALALVLSSAGVFGVAAYTVARRTHEIGVRMALGAQPARVLRLVVGQGLAAVAAGLGLGLLAARMLGRFVEGFLYGTTPTDPATLAGASGLLAAVALVAMALPARRATRIDPLRVLRED